MPPRLPAPTRTYHHLPGPTGRLPFDDLSHYHALLRGRKAQIASILIPLETAGNQNWRRKVQFGAEKVQKCFPAENNHKTWNWASGKKIKAEKWNLTEAHETNEVRIQCEILSSYLPPGSRRPSEKTFGFDKPCARAFREFQKNRKLRIATDSSSQRRSVLSKNIFMRGKAGKAVESRGKARGRQSPRANLQFQRSNFDPPTLLRWELWRGKGGAYGAGPVNP